MFRKLFVLVALPAIALTQIGPAFEARMVKLKIDMPATHEGIDLHPERDQPLDRNSYQRRTKQFGIAIHSGQSILLTKVKVKDKVIEFHLGGGGYGTFWDEKETVSASSAYKSSRERSLESQLRSQKDPSRRRSIESSLRSERQMRERKNDRARADAVVATEIRKERVGAKRLDGGSRINIKFETEAAAQSATPDFVQKLLASYVSFEAP